MERRSALRHLYVLPFHVEERIHQQGFLGIPPTIDGRSTDAGLGRDPLRGRISPAQGMLFHHIVAVSANAARANSLRGLSVGGAVAGDSLPRESVFKGLTGGPLGARHGCTSPYQTSYHPLLQGDSAETKRIVSNRMEQERTVLRQWPDTVQNWKPKYNPWLITVVVALAAFMEVLDTSIANVSSIALYFGRIGRQPGPGAPGY